MPHTLHAIHVPSAKNRCQLYPLLPKIKKSSPQVQCVTAWSRCATCTHTFSPPLQYVNTCYRDRAGRKLLSEFVAYTQDVINRCSKDSKAWQNFPVQLRRRTCILHSGTVALRMVSSLCIHLYTVCSICIAYAQVYDSTTGVQCVHGACDACVRCTNGWFLSQLPHGKRSDGHDWIWRFSNVPIQGKERCNQSHSTCFILFTGHKIVSVVSRKALYVGAL